MFNYNLLDDNEFELLCKDMMSKKLGEKLYSFPRGRDGGIDISDKEVHPKIVIQVKHFMNSSVSNLLSSLRKEIPKLEILKPENYYVFTSLGLTRSKRTEIIEMFPSYMQNLENIVTKEEIDDFLSNPLNQDILTKHSNLWIQSVNILSQFQSKSLNIDSYALLGDIEQRKEYYIKTREYAKASKRIANDHILLITGNPGVGKTTICEMIVLDYLKDDYRVIYASTNDLSSVKESMLQSNDSKQIILLDDFLGQHYLKISDTKSAELKTLLSVVKVLENTKLLINSRVTILNEAKQKDPNFIELHEFFSKYEFNINMDSIDEEDKEKMFRRHLSNNKISKNYIDYLLIEDHFLQIINHSNYNPRIIEYVSKNKNVDGKTEELYYQFIMSKLDNPKDVWQDEFENRIEPIDRIFLYTLYSLSEGRSTYEHLKLAFEKRIYNEKSIDKTINNYERILSRLSNSLINISEGYYGIEISTINPSLNEYIHKTLQSNIGEQIKILENAYFYDQIINTVNHEIHRYKRIEKLFEPKILSYPTSGNYQDTHLIFLSEIIKYRIADASLLNKIKISANNLRGLYFTDSGEVKNILNRLIYDDYYGIYNFVDILIESNNLDNILMFIDSKNNLISIFEKCYSQNNYLPENFIAAFVKQFNQIVIRRLIFVFRLNTFGIDLEKELSSCKKSDFKSNVTLRSNLIDNLYEKAKGILSSKVILEYVDTRFEIMNQDLDEIVDGIFTKEDIELLVTDSLSKRRIVLRDKVYFL